MQRHFSADAASDHGDFVNARYLFGWTEPRESEARRRGRAAFQLFACCTHVEDMAGRWTREVFRAVTQGGGGSERQSAQADTRDVIGHTAASCCCNSSAI